MLSAVFVGDRGHAHCRENSAGSFCESLEHYPAVKVPAMP
jgi:hypothetical protein